MIIESDLNRVSPIPIISDRLTIPSSSQRAFDGGFSEVDDEKDSAVTTVRAAWKGDGEDCDAESVDSDFKDPPDLLRLD